MYSIESPLVEILFARGLVKVLFATETFAMVRSFPEGYVQVRSDHSLAGSEHAC